MIDADELPAMGPADELFDLVDPDAVTMEAERPPWWDRWGYELREIVRRGATLLAVGLVARWVGRSIVRAARQ